MGSEQFIVDGLFVGEFCSRLANLEFPNFPKSLTGYEYFNIDGSYLFICVLVFCFAPISRFTVLIQMFQGHMSYVQMQVPTFCSYRPSTQAMSGLDYISVFPK